MKYLPALILTFILIACQSDQDQHLNKINDLQLELIDSEFNTNLEVTQELVVEIENYLSKYPDSTTMPDYYMQLGDLYTNVLRLPVKGLYFFQKVHSDFPNHHQAPVALFYKAFTLDNYMGQQDQARLVYESFLKTYPNHELSETVELSIQQLGIPLDELVKQFEEKNN